MLACDVCAYRCAATLPITSWLFSHSAAAAAGDAGQTFLEQTSLQPSL